MRKKFVKGKTKIKKQKGFVTILLILVVIILGLSLSGILSSKKFDKTGGQTIQGNANSCCDSGDGDACKPLTGPGQTLEYNGAEYGLLKSSVRFEEGIFHLKDSGLKNSNGDPIILNASEGYGGYAECGGNNDQIFGPGRTCVPIPNDQLLYVCRENCKTAVLSSDKDKRFCVTSGTAVSPKTYCYGGLDTVYDVYFRTADYPTPGVPEVISKCSIPSGQQTSGPTIVFNKEDGKENLQLKTFEFTQGSSGPIPYLSPYCKPAIYLYPKELAYVNVKVLSDKPFTYTDPLYPEGGWSVLADPSGVINYQNQLHDYLYYETQVSDHSVDKPTEGYVVTKGELSGLFSDLLPRLGLNKKESQQFSEYWIGALPTSPYYFVGIVPQKNLDELTNLVINPKPATIIRVTLYFEALNQKIEINEPEILTPKRNGFTVVEWGGIYKREKDTKFSCFQ